MTAARLGLGPKDAVARFNISKRTLARANAILREGSAELIKAIDDGQVAVDAMETILKLPKTKQLEAALKKSPPRPASVTVSDPVAAVSNAFHGEATKFICDFGPRYRAWLETRPAFGQEGFDSQHSLVDAIQAECERIRTTIWEMSR